MDRLQGVEVVVHPLAVLRRRLLTPSGLARIAVSARRDRDVIGELARDAALVHANTSVIVERADVVHVREIYAGAAGGLAARMWPLWRRRLMQADARICVSKAVAAQFDPAGTHVIYDGIPKQCGRDHRVGGLVREAPFEVAVLGRIADWKGQNVLIRSLAEPALAEIGVRAVIAGDAYPGEQAPDIQALARTLGVQDRVEIKGFVPDPYPLLASVDAVAVPSTRPDPLPNSALEALAAGKPVIAANHGGLPEIVDDGVTGLLVAPGDPAELAKAIRTLADDPERRAQMSAAAANDDRFGIERMLDEVEATYASLGIQR